MEETKSHRPGYRAERSGMTNLSYTSIDSVLWSVQFHLMRKYGCDTAARDVAPLRWYINTGRASVSFLKALVNAKPFMVARKLHQGGSDDAMIKRVSEYLANN